MDVELGYALAPPATPGIARESLERLDRRVAEAHGRIEAGIARGGDGYCALDVSDRTDVDAITAAVDALPPHDSIVVVGMGGSALGARTVASALAPAADCHVLDTLDPVHLNRVLDELDLERTICHVVSKSGSTIETRAIFEHLTRAMADAGVDWSERTIATTRPDGPLGERLTDAGVARLDPPAGVPGRYSVLSTMALPSAAALGVDIEGLLDGASRAHEALEPTLFDTPAYAYGAAMVALADRGATQNAFVTYAEDLTPLAHWFSQLWAESLGKDGLGQTPIPGRGVADHHSQLQRWRAGRRDLVVTTLADGGPTGPSVEVDNTEVALGALGELERRAMEASLGDAGVPAVRLEAEATTPAGLGKLFVSLQAATIMAAELWGIDPFDQPAVDWTKAAVRGELGLDEAAEAPALDPKSPLRVERDQRG